MFWLAQVLNENVEHHEQTTKINTTLIEAGDRFLDFHQHDLASYERVHHVLDKYEAMVTLARERALEELQIPEKVIPIQRHPRYSYTASTKEGA